MVKFRMRPTALGNYIDNTSHGPLEWMQSLSSLTGVPLAPASIAILCGCTVPVQHLRKTALSFSLGLLGRYFAEGLEAGMPQAFLTIRFAPCEGKTKLNRSQTHVSKRNEAFRKRRRRHPELSSPGRCRMVVYGLEVGRRPTCLEHRVPCASLHGCSVARASSRSQPSAHVGVAAEEWSWPTIKNIRAGAWMTACELCGRLDGVKCQEHIVPSRPTLCERSALKAKACLFVHQMHQ